MTLCIFLKWRGSLLLPMHFGFPIDGRCGAALRRQEIRFIVQSRRLCEPFEPAGFAVERNGVQIDSGRIYYLPDGRIEVR